MEPLRLSAIICTANPNNYLDGGRLKPKMFAKSCPNCARRSYSSDKLGHWTCPYCGANLTRRKPEEAK